MPNIFMKKSQAFRCQFHKIEFNLLEQTKIEKCVFSSSSVITIPANMGLFKGVFPTALLRYHLLKPALYNYHDPPLEIPVRSI